MEVYLDEWMMFSLLKKHIKVLWLMLDRCRKPQISLNFKKCIFCALFGILLGHVIYKKGLLVDPTKIVVIMDLPSPTTLWQLRAMLGHTSYYWKFIKGYAKIKGVEFQWTEECQQALDMLKEKMVFNSNSIFPRLDQGIPCEYWCFFHCITCDFGLANDGEVDHPISFASHKL